MTIDDFDDPQLWARRQWGQARLGDRRRTERAVSVGASLAALPSGSLPQQITAWGQLKAAYRLFSRPEVTHRDLSLPHWRATREAAAGAPAVVLFLQDTTELDFTSHPHTTGLGHVGNARGRGLLLHTALAIVPAPSSPHIIGLAAQSVWTRQAVKHGHETRHERRHRRTEADVWAETLEEIGPAPARESGVRFVSVGDRASDVFSYLRRARALGWHCLLRVCQDRVVEVEGVGEAHLLEWARGLRARAGKTIALRGRDGRARRGVELRVAWGEARVSAPRLGPERDASPVRGWVIRCWEESAEEEPIEWLLLTTLETGGRTEALERVEWYASRWVIEEYHKCLKTGCRIERRQLESAERIEALLGLLSIVAVRLLRLREVARTEPERPAVEEVPGEAIEAVRARLGLARAAPLTVREFWHGVARLGGFIGRLSDGEPGWQTLWRGWERVQDMCWGARLADRTR